MIPALSLEDVLERVRDVTDERDALGERLVSMVFAPPHAELYRELEQSRAYLDAQTGRDWDLFFIGWTTLAGRRAGGAFQADRFRQVEEEVRKHHMEALERAGMDSFTKGWWHRGLPELVSVLAHHGQPDWLSLTAYVMDGVPTPVTLAEVAARQGRWRAGHDDTMFWRDPARTEVGPGVGRLGQALFATATAIGGGVAANGAYELITDLVSKGNP